MKHRSRLIQGVILFAAVVSGLFATSVFAGNDDSQHKMAQEGTGHSHGMAAMHGGQVTMTKEFHFEVAFDRQSVKVYVYDGSQKPVSAKGLSGTVTVNFKDRDKEPLEAKLSYSNSKSAEMAQDFLQSDLDMTKVKEGEAKAVFVFENLPGDQEKTVTFKESFKLARMVTYACPMNCIEPTDHPGECPKCGMTLKRTETIYACSMHPNVTSREPGDKCFVCGMELTGGGDDDDDGHGHDH